ncbi:hypothetical protein COCSUDRAFT_55407 [Coccomyxa subellipsoidea C-169]|uniref:Uncharacterized protein n=1 Tax=Coccomyxa subellipsoidea (strain C-169) TaxID=574566 RepID=I0Z9S5_COCSC|nr:hypothetical protein COCSUDRAFT_55407 [Coccomyxa subellipsoidea C-169]EIE27394.1 hypothetical protein COCSUDRAFT_55407 [Coccomyxa subellipsoidea C-169]|eukprot:XP_005651938.1 hypothetical protein COCSUDRAFT_55407 [Coccomyxa subellipsoidea C-169]
MPGKTFATGGKTPGLGRRKALGNITNTERKAGDTAPATKPRRALGDITNATPVQSSQSKAKHAETNLQKSALPQSYAKQVALKSLAELYAEDGVERMAGKTWREMSKEQQQRDDADIKRRVTAFTSVPYRMPFSLLNNSRHRRAPIVDKPVPVPRPPSPPPSLHNSLDLDDLPSLDSLILQPPSIDWTFGGLLKEDSSQQTSAQTQPADGVTAAAAAADAAAAATGPD